MHLGKIFSSNYDAGHGYERRRKKKRKDGKLLQEKLSTSLLLLEITPEKTLLL